MIQRLGISFALASDAEQKVVKGFGVQNPETSELALHAVYIVDEKSRVIYRKVAGRRPVSAELIDAIDAHRGVYPRNDRREEPPERRVAYPSNNFQTLIEMSNAHELPSTVAAARRSSLCLTKSPDVNERVIVMKS